MIELGVRGNYPTYDYSSAEGGGDFGRRGTLGGTRFGVCFVQNGNEDRATSGRLET